MQISQAAVVSITVLLFTACRAPGPSATSAHTVAPPTETSDAATPLSGANTSPLTLEVNTPPTPTSFNNTVTPTIAPTHPALPPTVTSSTPTPDFNGPLPPSIIKSIGFTRGEIDLAAGVAGDILLTGIQPPGGKIIYDYGEEITETSEGIPKINLQPAFYLPMGTKVRSLIDGVVINIPVLWSSDYSIQVAPSMSSKYVWETEHVLNPSVQVGDYVVAGQVIGEVSNFMSPSAQGPGAVEIGILEGGNPPQHHCPFLYLDPSVKSEIENWLVELRAAWEQAQGNPDIYDESAYATPGCKITEPIEG